MSTRLLILFAVAFLGIAMVPPAWSEPPADAKPMPVANPALDRFGDPLPASALRRLGTIRFRHVNAVIFLAFAPDGKTLFAHDGTSRVSLWEVATGKERRQYKGQAYGPYTTGLSSNGKMLAVIGDNQTVQLWEAATGKELGQIARPANNIGFIYLALSRDGKTLALVSHDQSVGLWEVATGKQVARLYSPPVQANQEGPGLEVAFTVTGLTFSPDGKTLVVGGNTGGNKSIVRLWDVATAKELDPLPALPNANAYPQFSPDGKILIVKDGSLNTQLLDFATRKEIRQLPTRAQCGTLLEAFCPDSTLLAYGSGEHIVIEEAVTGKEVRRFHAQPLGVSFVAFSPDGKVLATGGSTGTIRLWEVASGKEITGFDSFQGPVWSLVHSPDGKVLATPCADQTIRLWEAATGRELRRLARPPQAKEDNAGNSLGFPYVAFGRDGKTLAAAWNDGLLCLWDVDSGKKLGEFADRGGPLASLLFSPDGKTLAAAGQDGWVRLRDTATGKERRRFQVINKPNGNAIPGSSLSALAFSPDGKTLLTAVHISQFTNNLFLGGEGRLLNANTAGNTTIQLWETATGKERRQFQFGGHSLGGVGLYGMGGGDAGYFYWGGNGSWISAVAFSHDGNYLALGAGSLVILWDLARGREIRRFDFGSYSTPVFALSPDGKLLAKGGGDGAVSLWDLATGTELVHSKGHRGALTAIAFAPDSKTVVSAGMETTVLVWDVKRLLAEGRRRPTALTPEQLEALWKELAGEDATQAYQAVWTLAGVPKQALPLLQGRLRAVPAVEAGRIAKLIGDLDSNSFDERRKATEELEKLGDLAESALQKVLSGQAPLEVRQRVELLLEKLQQAASSPEQLRPGRALEVLERIGTAEARTILEKLAKGAPEARLAREAQEALERLARQGAATER